MMSYTRDDYYIECIEIAAEECGANLTNEQVRYIGEAVAGSVENESMAFGHDIASANLTARERREVDELKQRLHYEQTVPRERCENCKGRGYLLDGWGRQFGCNRCDGEGSNKIYKFRYSASKDASK